ncbi:MAG: M23 family metallopeptidase [Candidatus Coatesbacteria bacterium]|nr:M23 family metallopeptidase [Candidatus Coatesbacteria bacterium]
MNFLKDIWKNLIIWNRFLPYGLLFILIIGIFLVFISVRGLFIEISRKSEKKEEPVKVEEKIKPSGYYPELIEVKTRETWNDFFLRIGQPENRIDSLVEAFKENKDVGISQKGDKITLFSKNADGSIDSLELQRESKEIYRGYRTSHGWLMQCVTMKEGLQERALVCTLSTRMQPMLAEKYNNPAFIKQAIQFWARYIGTKKCREKGTVFSFLITEQVLPGGRREFKQLWWSKAETTDRTYQLAFYPSSLKQEEVVAEDDSLPILEKDPGEGLYYTETGKCLHRIALIIPLRFKRISSNYRIRRMHPILKRYRPHLAIDFVAKKGTPVRAASSGTVVMKGRSGGYGNMIAIKHMAGVVTYYGHLNSFAKGVNKGTFVKTGRVIGYVGSTGLSTGPHLDYRIKVGGRNVNPLKNRLISFPPLNDIELSKLPALLQNYSKRFDSLMEKRISTTK